MKDVATTAKVGRWGLLSPWLFAAFKRKQSLTSVYKKIRVLDNEHPVLWLIASGTFVLVSLVTLMLLFSLFVLGNHYVVARLVPCLIAFIYVLLGVVFLRQKRYRTVSWMFVGLYSFVSALVLLNWSINSPFGILLLGFVIILAGALLGTRYIISVTLVAMVALAGLQYIDASGIYTADISSLSLPSATSDVFSYSIVFIVFATVAWVSARQTERSLKKALAAESALEHEKKMLEIRLEERTRNLREAQMEEMSQLHRFAELGQTSTSLLHELANHLSVLTMDIEDLEQRSKGSVKLQNAKESINHLDVMVSEVRRKLSDSNSPEDFFVYEAIADSINALKTRASEKGVQLVFSPTQKNKKYHIVGDSLQLSQALTILVANAIEAYDGMENGASKRVIVELSVMPKEVSISVSDWGIGIPRAKRAKLFEPFKSTKINGLGIGLFIARKMITSHFKGFVKIDTPVDHTRFVIILPREKKI